MGGIAASGQEAWFDGRGGSVIGGEEDDIALRGGGAIGKRRTAGDAGGEGEGKEGAEGTGGTGRCGKWSLRGSKVMGVVLSFWVKGRWLRV